MKKIILIALLAIFCVLAIPPLRTWADPVVGPILADASARLEPQLDRVRTPYFRWEAKSEARTIAEGLRQDALTGQSLPRPADFQAYLRRRTINPRDVADRWGSPYYLQLQPDSIVVISPGPDGRPGTEDDIRAAEARN